MFLSSLVILDSASEMETAVILFIILGVNSGLTRGAGVLPDGPLNAAMGGMVMFNIAQGKPFLTLTWKFGDGNIITFSGRNITAPEYEDRITLFMSTGSLELRNVTLNDSGEYSVTFTPAGGIQQEGTTRLDVYERVSRASVTSSTDQLIEGNPVNLTCEAAGSVFNRTWMKDSSKLTLGDNTQLHDNNRVLSFHPLKKADSGEYSCKISNPVSSDQAYYNMVFNYKPQSCPAGCIAGIVIACLIICAAAAGGGYCIYNKKVNAK